MHLEDIALLGLFGIACRDPMDRLHPPLVARVSEWESGKLRSVPELERLRGLTATRDREESHSSESRFARLDPLVRDVL